jgi:hypothetical protein
MPRSGPPTAPGQSASSSARANNPDEWFVYALVNGVSSGNWEFVQDPSQGGGLSHVNLFRLGPLTDGPLKRAAEAARA